MQKTVKTTWTFTKADVENAIRKQFGLPADAVVIVNSDGSARASQEIPNFNFLLESYLREKITYQDIAPFENKYFTKLYEKDYIPRKDK